MFIHVLGMPSGVCFATISGYNFLIHVEKIRKIVINIIYYTTILKLCLIPHILHILSSFAYKVL